MQLLSAGQTHLKILNGANLLLETTDLLGVGVLRGISGGGGSGSRSTRTLGLLLVSMAIAVRVASAARLVVARLASVAVVASFGAATLMASVVRGRSQASSTIRFTLGSTTLALGVLLVSLLLILGLGRVLIAHGLSTRNSPDSGSLLGKFRTWHTSAWATKTVGTNVGNTVAYNVGSTTLVLTLKVKGRGQTTSTGRTVSTSRLAGGLRRSQERRGRGVGYNIVQLNHIFVVHNTTVNVPQLDTVVHTESRRSCSSHDVAAVGTPLADTGVSALDSGDLSEILLEVVNIDLTSEIAESCNQNKTASWNKYGDSMVLAARSEGKVGGTLDSELVPDRNEIVALVELDLVCYETSTVLLIGRVLKVPALLLLLNKTAKGLLILTSNTLLYNTPDLKVLGGIAILILARALPGDDESATRRETEFVNVKDRERKDLLTSRGINNGDNLRGGPTEVTSTGRVNTVSEVALGLVEPSERLVDGRSVKDADGLLGSVGKLQRRRHG
ncbi:hypothetical protein HG531_006068 [Fusarium graminearum]|nr:hypothetical protein HG531_006068 [Fusarium graminearum]